MDQKFTETPKQTDASRQEARRNAVRRLDASYSVGGREALAKMTGVEVYVLYSEKRVDLKAATSLLAKYPHDEVAQVRREKAEREVNDIAGFIKEAHRSTERERELER